jgi:hypothetical protein
MARQLRIQYQGAIYHVLNRGDRGEEIFQDDLERKSFLQALGRTCRLEAGTWNHVSNLPSRSNRANSED